MKVTIVPGSAISQWSYSRYAQWVACPFAAYQKYVLKKKDESSPAMERGSAIHKKIEDYLKGTTKVVPVEVDKQLHGYYKLLKKEKYQPELELAFTAKWEPTGWFDRNVYVRIKVEALAPDASVIIDHKTGQPRGGYGEQMELYGLAGHLLNPTAVVVRADLAFTDKGIVVEESFRLRELKKFARKWDAKVKPMLMDRTFTPAPSEESCKWCVFKKSRGGPCPVEQ